MRKCVLERRDIYDPLGANYLSYTHTHTHTHTLRAIKMGSTYRLLCVGAELPCQQLSPSAWLIVRYFKISAVRFCLFSSTIQRFWQEWQGANTSFSTLRGSKIIGSRHPTRWPTFWWWHRQTCFFNFLTLVRARFARALLNKKKW